MAAFTLLIACPPLAAQRQPDFSRLPTRRVDDTHRGLFAFEATRPLTRDQDLDRALLRALLEVRGEGYGHVALVFGDGRGFFDAGGEDISFRTRNLNAGGVVLVGYRDKPRTAVRHGEVDAIAGALAARLKVALPPAPASRAPTWEPKFEIGPRFRGAPARDPELVVVRRAMLGVGAEAIVIGQAVELESPWTDPFQEEVELRRLAAAKGADVVIVDDDPASLAESGFAVMIGWVAQVGVRPEATLGIQWEPGERARRRFVVRRFHPDSLADEAGLRIGDTVLAFDGVDVLDGAEFDRTWLGWRPGQSVSITVVRDGREERIEAETISNTL